MNFKTFLEKTEEETEPKIVNFKREIHKEGPGISGYINDYMHVDYKGKHYKIFQRFYDMGGEQKVFSGIILYKRKRGLWVKIPMDLNDQSQGYMAGGEFYRLYVDKKLTINEDEFEVLRYSLLNDRDRRGLIRKFEIKNPKTREHFGDIIGGLSQ